MVYVYVEDIEKELEWLQTDIITELDGPCEPWYLFEFPSPEERKRCKKLMKNSMWYISGNRLFFAVVKTHVYLNLRIYITL
jgi:hypothetical protein